MRDYRAYKDRIEQLAETGQFVAGVSSAGGGANFDNVSLTFIPEPTTWLLVCMGGGLAAAIRRRR